MQMRETSRAIDKKLWVNNYLKKQVKKIPETKETFYRKCIENGCREILPDYVWNKQFNNQMSYAFSIPHCTAYSWIDRKSTRLNSSH